MPELSRAKADIIPYSDEYSATVRSWIDSEETLRHVCRAKGFPPADDIVDSWQRKGVSSYILSADGKPVAYGELWDRKMERAMEIAHLLVDQYRRSQGYGTKLLQLLFQRASTRPDLTKVLINLYTDSSEALGCYLKAGFELAGTSQHVSGLRLIRTVSRFQ